MELNKIKKSKQIFAIASTIPLGFFFGMALRIGLTSIETELEKYNVNSFSIMDTLKIDTALVKRGELYIDTLVDYSKLSKKEISFKTSRVNLKPDGILSVENKEISKYNLLKNGSLSEEIIEQNNEIKNYSLTGEFIGKGFKLNKLELIKYGKNFNSLGDSFNITISPQRDTGYKSYKRDTDLGNKILDNEQAEVKKYLNKIKEYKKIKGLWKD